MFTQISIPMKAVLYYIITLGLAIGVALMAGWLGDSSRIVTMFAPLTAVLLMLLVVTRDGYSSKGWEVLGLHRAGLRKWGLAIGLPLVIMGVTYGIVWSTGIARLNLSGFSGWSSLLSGLFVGTAFALAEEIGWRGYLLPHLVPLGRTRAMLLSGLLHGIYHLPLIYMTPFYHEGGNRFLVTILLLLTFALAGIGYGYLRLTTDSVWPAAIAHNAFNTYWETFMGMTVVGASPVLLEYLAGESGILTLIGVGVAAVWLLNRLSRQLDKETAAPRLRSAPLAR